MPRVRRYRPQKVLGFRDFSAYGVARSAGSVVAPEKGNLTGSCRAKQDLIAHNNPGAPRPTSCYHPPLLDLRAMGRAPTISQEEVACAGTLYF